MAPSSIAAGLGAGGVACADTAVSAAALTNATDSQAMAAHTHVAVGYNVQIAVDAKHKLIVEPSIAGVVRGAERLRLRQR